MGAEAVMDGLDASSVCEALSAACLEVVVHQVTALAGLSNLRRFDRAFALTNRLRTEGTRNLLQAAAAAGVRRLVAQSFTGWTGLHRTTTRTSPCRPRRARTNGPAATCAEIGLGVGPVRLKQHVQGRVATGTSEIGAGVAPASI
jgi:nucleoside-diphosphate-sugar epimerase